MVDKSSDQTSIAVAIVSASASAFVSASASASASAVAASYSGHKDIINLKNNFEGPSPSPSLTERTLCDRLVQIAIKTRCFKEAWRNYSCSFYI